MSTHNIPYQYKKKRKSPKIIPNTIMVSAMGFCFCQGLKSEFKIAMINEPLLYEPLLYVEASTVC